MIDLDLPKELRKFQDDMHKFANEVFRPISRKYDMAEHKYPEELDMMRGMAHFDRKKKTDKPEAVKKESQGPRIGASMRAVISSEEISWGDPSFLIAIPNAGLGNVAMVTSGTDEQFEKYGDKWLAMAITEPGAGSDTSSITTTAKLDENEWVLNGEKIFVSCADRCDAVIVMATIDKKAGKSGIKSFIVDKGTDGFVLEKLELKMGLRGSDTGTFVLSDCRIPKENILGGYEAKVAAQKNKTEGFKGTMKAFDTSRPMVAAMAIGTARAALEYTREVMAQNDIKPDYTKGANNISSMEKDYYLMEANLEASRLLTWRSAWMADNKLPNSCEASMAKAKAGRQGVLISQKCCDLLGPMGFSTKNLAEKWLRDVRVMDIFEGTGQIQHLIVAKSVLNISSIR
jgi:acyl-CoA dehydrogenase